MAGDGILEIHGCYVRKKGEEMVMFSVSEYGGCVWFEPIYSQLKFTPSQARYLAKQLIRLADRIDARNSPQVAASASEAKARGGHAAAALLTPEQRSERARVGANARWKKAAAK